MAGPQKNEGKKRSERIRKKKLTLFKNAGKLGSELGIDVAVIVFQHGRYYLGVWSQRASWPPDITEIVSESSLKRIYLTYNRKIHSHYRNSITRPDGRSLVRLDWEIAPRSIIIYR